jgi:heme exporter protein B
VSWLSGAIAVLAKDVQLELRSRYALNTLLLFAVSSLLIVAFAIGGAPLTSGLRAVILWIIILFSAIAGLSHAFVSEEERGTILLLQLNATPSSVFVGKLMFNLGLSLLMNAVVAILFAVVLGFGDADVLTLAVILLLGAIGLSGATTLISAIIARTPNKGPLFAVLSFPILVPLLLSVVGGTTEALDGGTISDVFTELSTLVGYAGMVITASILLFDYLWRD